VVLVLKEEVVTEQEHRAGHKQCRLDIFRKTLFPAAELPPFPHQPLQAPRLRGEQP